MESIRSLLLDFSGRIRRRTWWIANTVLFLLSMLIVYLLQPEIYSIEIDPAPPTNLAVDISSLLIAVPLFALTSKRLNDRNRPRWIFYFIVAIMLPFYIGPFFNVLEGDSFGGWQGPAWIVFALASIWILIDNGFLPGTSGPNQYGPDPKES
ncbi:MAG: DUF805 domain-containing protein [Pseudomonadota bacterium]